MGKCLSLPSVVGRHGRGSPEDTFGKNHDYEMISSAEWSHLQASGGNIMQSRDPAPENQNQVDAIDSDSAFSCTVSLRNCTDQTLYLCWVDYQGKLHHFQPIHPKGAIEDGSVSNVAKHYTQIHHCFVFYRLQPLQTDTESNAAALAHFEHINEIPTASFVCCYRPLEGWKAAHFLTTTGSFAYDDIKPVSSGVSVSVSVQSGKKESPSQEDANVSGGKVNDENVLALVDNSYIVYRLVTEGLSGFQVHCEECMCLTEGTITSGNDNGNDNGNGNGNGNDTNVTGSKVLSALRADLEQVARMLPTHALLHLQQHVRIFVNACCVFGSACNPESSGVCYHPMGSHRWLQEKRLPTDHERAIEIFKARSYLDSRVLWGTGGLLLHELCHAYHDQCLPGGYDNQPILQAYTIAEASGIYDWVIHKKALADSDAPAKDEEDSPYTLAPPTRGYCMADRMEYFAELSTAWHCECVDVGNPPEEGSAAISTAAASARTFTSAAMFNKWYPFNRSQLLEVDRGSAEVLAAAWAGCT